MATRKTASSKGATRSTAKKATGRAASLKRSPIARAAAAKRTGTAAKSTGARSRGAARKTGGVTRKSTTAKRQPEKGVGERLVESAKNLGQWTADTAKELVEKGAEILNVNTKSRRRGGSGKSRS